jgi:hypothetical protein
MSDIERTVGTNSRNTARVTPSAGRSGLTIEPDALGRGPEHVSQFDPDLECGDQLGVGFTWISLELPTASKTQQIPARRTHLGWSLFIATVSNIILGATAIATGATLVGLVACSALSIATCLLVLAEIACRYGIDPVGHRPPGVDDWFLDDRQ